MWKNLKMNMKISAVIVTYNRKEMLLQCVKTLLNQTIQPDCIYIMDNHSTDGTYKCLKEAGVLLEASQSVQVDKNSKIQYQEKENNDKKCEIYYQYLENNLGGAGGFSRGISMAYRDGADAVWIMDDDVLPEKNCLESLLEGREKIRGKVSFLASAVRGAHGEAMNVPKLDKRQFLQYTDWYEYLEYGIVNIKKATFVSLLISREAIKACGVPWEPFFIWGDDSEYTQRLIRDYGPAYMVGSSKVLHLRGSREELSIVKEENKARIPLYYYYYRNNFIGFWEYESFLYRFLCFGKFWLDFFKVILVSRYKMLKLMTMMKAMVSFITGSYGKKAFQNRSYMKE